MHTSFIAEQPSSYSSGKTESGGSSNNTGSARTISRITSVVKNNGFNPVWQQTMSIPFDCVGDMKDLIFVRFQVKDEYDGTDLAVYCISLGSLLPGKEVLLFAQNRALYTETLRRRIPSFTSA